MAIPRFYAKDLPATGLVRLSPEDARHARSVLRLKVGDRAIVFNGCGLEADCTVANVGKTETILTVVNARNISRELQFGLDLYVSLPKGDRQRQLVELLVQFGVRSLTPLVSLRSVAQPTDNTIERLRRTVIESSKQCGRNHLMEIQPAVHLDQLAISPAISQTEHEIQSSFFAHPYGSTQWAYTALQSALQTGGNTVRVIIGPEGGLAEEECNQLYSKGWQKMGLGSRTLRVEAAAVCIAAMWAGLHDIPQL